MVIRTVVFDYGGVIMEESAIPRMCAELAASVGVSWDTWSEKSHKLRDELHRNATSLLTGKLSVEEFEETVLHDAIDNLYGLSRKEKLRVVTDGFHSRDVDFNQCMLDLLPELRAKGILLGLLTNIPYVDREKTYSLLKVDTSLFDVIVESCAVETMKPQEEIYEITHKRILEIDPTINKNEVIFLDDLPGYCEAAKQFGWQVLQVNPKAPEDAAQQLQRLLKHD